MTRSSLTQPDVSSEGSSSRGRLCNILRKPASSLALRISDLERYRLNMWEVGWGDTHKETRKEHREKKASKPPKPPKSTSSDKTKTKPKARSIFSRGSSSSSEAPSFGSFSRRRNAERSIASTSDTSSTSARTCPTECNYGLESDRFSNFSTSSEQTTINVARVVDISHKRNGQILDNHQDLYLDESLHADLPSPTLTSSSAPPWDTEMTERIALEPCHVIQALSDDSFVARSTEITTTMRTCYDTPYLMSCGVTIMADPDCKVTNRPKSSNAQSKTPRRPLSSRSSAPKSKTLNRMPSSTVPLRIDITDGWKPPNEWDCAPTEPPPTPQDEPLEAPELGIPQEMSAMQRDVKLLATESNMLRLIRLTESQGINGPPSSCKDLEVEKMQWMLSAMYNMDQPAINDDSLEYVSDPPKKVLALYETPAVTAYLAAINHNKQVYHLSAAPLSHTVFPNVHPVLVPGKSPSAFPIAPSTIEAVNSLRLPLAMPSQDIPALLRNIHRCLEPGGSLQLTIIDPLPVTNTLGPRLRHWIESNLLFNLEANFRCTTPSKLLPLWLNNASLRVDPTMIEAIPFFAIPLENNQLQYVKDGRLPEEGLKQELRNLVGRMLWMEVWREYIIADYWWWEDPEILQECIELNTTWEWRLIEAVKEA
ncbi:hypothetical protein FSARC_13466 [Fusarium sarcochroum]|uniref:Uncharacterized protein n=1 Tax=Fusarium sarcochroum TaxID=1208366 RepID=A0A8H4T1J2_9HYPO|nr:hypothetical protein FSARC_13466 [Fusarium sarcochroum]